MNIQEWKKELEEWETKFLAVAGIALLNNMLDREIVRNVSKESDSAFSVAGVLMLKDTFLPNSHEEKQTANDLLKMGLLTYDPTTRDLKIVEKIPKNQQIDILPDIKRCISIVFSVTEKLQEEEDSIQDFEFASKLLNGGMQHLEILGYFAGYWIPEIFEKYEKLSHLEIAILSSCIRAEYDQKREQAIEKGVSWDECVQKFLDQGLITQKQYPEATEKYMIRPHRDFKDIAWPDFNEFTNPLFQKLKTLMEKIEELEK